MTRTPNDLITHLVAALGVAQDLLEQLQDRFPPCVIHPDVDWQPTDDPPPDPGTYPVRMQLLVEGHPAIVVLTYARWDGQHWYDALPEWGILNWAHPRADLPPSQLPTDRGRKHPPMTTLNHIRDRIRTQPPPLRVRPVLRG
jgi:hypothetical protein